MKLRFKRILALIIKELQIILADKNNRIMIILPPVLQLLLFAYTSTLEIKNISLTIYDKDNSQISQQLASKLENTPIMHKVFYVNNPQDMTDLMNKEKVFATLVIPQDFAKNIYNATGSELQILADGRRSNASQIVTSYVSSVVQKFGAELNEAAKQEPKIEVRTRHWFNPTSNYQWFIAVCMAGIQTMTMVFTITALAIAQEKEQGTFEQTIVSPLKPSEILIGKTIPAVLITLLDVTVMFIGSALIFKVPLAGSLLSLYGVMTVFLLCMAGIGLSMSVICKTQQQAVMGVFLFTTPVLMLSGFITPIENMPMILQKFSIFNPLTYFFVLMKGIFLKDISNIAIIQNCLPLMLMAVCTLTFSWWFFNKNLE